jgi:DNA-binding transcriptional ArsR family regulator
LASHQRALGPFRAFADPTRLTVAWALREADELCVCDLAWILERAQNLVSHHLRALRAEGLVDYRREGKMALYSLTERGRAMFELVGAGDPTQAARG